MQSLSTWSSAAPPVSPQRPGGGEREANGHSPEEADGPHAVPRTLHGDGPSIRTAARCPAVEEPEVAGIQPGEHEPDGDGRASESANCGSHSSSPEHRRASANGKSREG